MITLCCYFNLCKGRYFVLYVFCYFLFFSCVSCFSFLDEGYYQGGKFQFEIEVPDAYNMVVSICHKSNSCHFAFPFQVIEIQRELDIKTKKGSSVCY